jgi:outer membrane protein assembly factor BamE
VRSAQFSDGLVWGMMPPLQFKWKYISMRALLTCLLAIALAGCGAWGFPGVYRINIEQGNIVTQEMVDQLKPGMTRRQVRYILGTPLVEDSFDRDRWDYVYLLRNGYETIYENRLTVHFEGDSLSLLTGNMMPGGDDA